MTVCRARHCKSNIKQLALNQISNEFEMVMAIVAKIIDAVTPSLDKPELLRSQVAAFTRQIPMMYFIVCVNVTFLSATHFQYAPAVLTLGVPLILTALSIIRTIRWRQARTISVTDAGAAKALRDTIIFAILLGSGFVGWALMMFPYGDPFTQMHVIFFVGITFVVCALSLMHMRTAAFSLMFVVLVPFITFLSFTGNIVMVAIAANLALVAVAIAVILLNYYRDFEALSDSKVQLQKLHDEVVHLVETDSLTQLANRRHFFAQLGESLLHSVTTGERLTIGVLDLDGFKAVNDAFGHRAGDHVLIEVARRLRSIDKDFACIARLGGDEFGIIVNGEKSDAELRVIGLSICLALRVPYRIADTLAQLGGSVGFASCPDAADSAEKLYECADYALYYAKNNARGTAVLFTAGHQGEIRELSLIDQTLRHINIREELSLAFQPIVDIETGQTVACEALARWTNAQLGLVQPSTFIRAAERSGMIGPLTELLLEKALVHAIDWPAHVRLSFNLSAFDLTSPSATARIGDIIANATIDPARIDLEVTETALMQNYDRARDALTMLKETGARISLDDFGSGYSSLSYVHQLPIDKIKIDRSFVAEIEYGGAGSEIVKTIIDLCRSLNLECVVEGVETPGQAAVLRGLGCRLMQGFWFAKPMTSEMLRHHLAENARGQCSLPPPLVQLGDQTRLVA
jgi:diguanylate cyclase (GGDEF)-like protein